MMDWVGVASRSAVVGFTYDRAWEAFLGVVGGEGDFSGGLLRLAGITITFLVLLDSVLDAMLLTQVLRHRGKEGYGGGNCEKSGD
jgi:hypothetical protein